MKIQAAAAAAEMKPTTHTYPRRRSSIDQTEILQHDGEEADKLACAATERLKGTGSFASSQISFTCTRSATEAFYTQDVDQLFYSSVP